MLLYTVETMVKEQGNWIPDRLLVRQILFLMYILRLVEASSYNVVLILYFKQGQE
jgi:hypothetical protein